MKIFSIDSATLQESILDVVNNYDAFFIDVFGVLYDGAILYKNTLETLEKLKNMGKKLVILSNATQVSDDAKLAFYKKGMIQGEHYDEFITSGEFLKYFLTNNNTDFCKQIGHECAKMKCIFMGNSAVFAGTGIKNVDDFADADFLYVGVPRSSYGAVRVDNVFDENGKHVQVEELIAKNWYNLKDDQGNAGLREFATQLEQCLKLNKTLLVANPDIYAFATLGEKNELYPIITQGGIAAYYQYIGGKVLFFGKPFPEIFNYAKTFVDAGDRIAMIGDTPWTDIVGANTNGLDSILVMTGVSVEVFENMDRNLPFSKKMETLLTDISPKMIHKKDLFEIKDFIPNIVLRRFSFS